MQNNMLACIDYGDQMRLDCLVDSKETVICKQAVKQEAMHAAHMCKYG